MTDDNTPNPDDLAERLAKVLREEGLTDRPDLYGSGIHSWRCEYPDRYGHCDCFAGLVGHLIPEVAAAERRGAVEALREAAADAQGMLPSYRFAGGKDHYADDRIHAYGRDEECERIADWLQDRAQRIGEDDA